MGALLKHIAQQCDCKTNQIVDCGLNHNMAPCSTQRNGKTWQERRPLELSGSEHNTELTR